MDGKNFELIRQSLAAAESSIKLAKQLLSELESGNSSGKINTKPNGTDLPGISGIFDGENMVSESGEVFPVPTNYASKSMLVVGDTLKLVEEGKNKEKRFKQIEHVKRHKSTGILTKKDGKWKVVTPEGSYKVLGAAVEHFGADIGTEVTLHLPASNLTVTYGAIEAVKGREKPAEDKPVEQKLQPSFVEPKNEVTKEPIKETVTAVKEAKTVVEEKKPEPKKEVSKVKPFVKKEPDPGKEGKVADPPPAKPEKSPEHPSIKVTVPPEPISAPAVAAKLAAQPAAAVSVSTPMEASPEEDELT